MSRFKPKVAHYTQIAAKEFGPTAPGTSIRVLINDENEGAPVYNMRMLEVKKGGNTPDHSHPYEHENFVIEGNGKVMIDGEWFDLKPGDVVFVPPNVRHQYRNSGNTILRFLCSVPVEKLRPTG